jgi:hypothetical protein
VPTIPAPLQDAKLSAGLADIKVNSAIADMHLMELNGYHPVRAAKAVMKLQEAQRKINEAIAHIQKLAKLPAR